ncbi:MAG: GTP-binding protein, partial [Candidatus Bathyarchaeia archaeon]
MSKFRQIPHILSLMANKALIRNLGIIAHIDHGKTTLTDALLAGTGLLPLKAAGSARVLDYLEEEQKRGITMKTANISLLYKAADSGAFIINLVDTPGHVDFTGKVTRALRSIDGAIVVIDAVEEIMPQTEVVLRQALEERVRPVLFINKVDRLITELKLTENQIRER